MCLDGQPGLSKAAHQPFVFHFVFLETGFHVS